MQLNAVGSHLANFNICKQLAEVRPQTQLAENISPVYISFRHMYKLCTKAAATFAVAGHIASWLQSMAAVANAHQCLGHN